jgi:hypothetical protein
MTSVWIEGYFGFPRTVRKRMRSSARCGIRARVRSTCSRTGACGGGTQQAVGSNRHERGKMLGKFEASLHCQLGKRHAASLRDGCWQLATVFGKAQVLVFGSARKRPASSEWELQLDLRTTVGILNFGPHGCNRPTNDGCLPEGQPCLDVCAPYQTGEACRADGMGRRRTPSQTRASTGTARLRTRGDGTSAKRGHQTIYLRWDARRGATQSMVAGRVAMLVVVYCMPSLAVMSAAEAVDNERATSMASKMRSASVVLEALSRC